MKKYKINFGKDGAKLCGLDNSFDGLTCTINSDTCKEGWAFVTMLDGTHFEDGKSLKGENYFVLIQHLEEIK